MALCTQAERLKALKEEERGEGAHTRAKVTQHDLAADHRVRRSTEGGAEDAPMVPRRGLSEGGKLRGGGPIEFACGGGEHEYGSGGAAGRVYTGVDDYAPNRGAVASYPLRCTVHCCEEMRTGA